MKRLLLFVVLMIFAPLSALSAATSPQPEANGSSAPAQTDVAGGTASISVKADTVTPYQNQPVLYTVRVVVRTGISGTSVRDIAIPNAIVEAKGDTDFFDEMEHGLPVRVAEFYYIITPLQPGKMTIPPILLQGVFNATPQSPSSFSTYDGAPFSIASNATPLSVKPPVAAMDPWLPLASLKISEKIDASRSVRVGDPVTRKITLSANGAVGSQLPEIGARQQFGNFRAYADKPAMGENIDSKTGVISGWRTDTYSAIAQSAGRLVLPAIRISWWDVVNNKRATAELPQRVLDILPAKVAQTQPIDGDRPEGQRWLHWPKNALADIGLALRYSGASVVIALLLFGAFRWWARNRKTLRLGETHFAALKAKIRLQNFMSEMFSGGTLSAVQTAEELKAFLQIYAHRHWGTPKNASLEKIFSLSPGSHAALDDDDMKALIQKIDAALYAGRPADMADLRKRSRRVVKALRRRAKADRGNWEELSILNPS